MISFSKIVENFNVAVISPGLKCHVKYAFFLDFLLNYRNFKTSFKKDSKIQATFPMIAI